MFNFNCSSNSRLFLSGSLLVSGSLFSQNLVLNPGFEHCSNTGQTVNPIDENVYYWSNPNESTSDYFRESAANYRYRSPKNEYGIQQPKSGIAYAGICLHPKHMEYLQGELSSGLVNGRIYCATLFISRGDYSKFKVKEMGMLFSRQPTQVWGTDALKEKPQLNLRIPETGKDTDDWIELCGRYEAMGGERYFTFGYFGTRELTATHYYADDFSIWEIREDQPCHCEGEVKVDVADTLAVGKSYVLRHIFFDFDRYQLLPASFDELDQLISILNQHPGMNIQVSGHTDNMGTIDFNQTLSENRARAVADYLEGKGIAADRITAIGFGRIMPVADNETEAGRKKNRRVEFKILSK